MNDNSGQEFLYQTPKKTYRHHRYLHLYSTLACDIGVWILLIWGYFKRGPGYDITWGTILLFLVAFAMLFGSLYYWSYVPIYKMRIHRDNVTFPIQSITKILSGKRKVIKFNDIIKIRFMFYGSVIELQTKDGITDQLQFSHDKEGYKILLIILKNKFPNLDVPNIDCLFNYDVKKGHDEIIQENGRFEGIGDWVDV